MHATDFEKRGQFTIVFPICSCKSRVKGKHAEILTVKQYFDLSSQLVRWERYTDTSRCGH